MTASRHMTMRSTAGSLLVLMALGIGWPAGVQAGCSNPHGTVPRHEVAHLDWLALAGALSVPIDEIVLDGPVSPCSGIHCSNAPGRIPPAAPTTVPTSDQWGYLADLASRPDTTFSPLPYDDTEVRPRHGGVSPFHPPR